MGYVKVKEESEDTLDLCREPSTRAWAILIGKLMTAKGIGYNVDISTMCMHACVCVCVCVCSISAVHKNFAEGCFGVGMWLV